MSSRQTEKTFFPFVTPRLDPCRLSLAVGLLMLLPALGGGTVFDVPGTGSVQIPSGAVSMSILAVGGGGAGGGAIMSGEPKGGGGGGAGRVVFGVLPLGPDKQFQPGQQIEVTVGAGGSSESAEAHQVDGGASVVKIGEVTLVRAGGGGGGGRAPTISGDWPGGSGGSGGGGGLHEDWVNFDGGAAEAATGMFGPGFGNPGSRSFHNKGGGGGGAGEARAPGDINWNGASGINLGEIAYTAPGLGLIYQAGQVPVNLDIFLDPEQRFAAGGGGGGFDGDFNDMWGCGLGGEGGGGQFEHLGGFDFNPGHASAWGSGGAGGRYPPYAGVPGDGYQGLVVIYFSVPPGDAPLVETLPPGEVLVDSATLSGNLVSAGQSDTTVYVYWGRSDGGTDTEAWDNTSTLAAPQQVGLISHTVDITEGDDYFYRFAASNQDGFVWAEATAYLLSSVTVEVDPETVSEDNETACFTFSRPQAATSQPLTVSFSVAGTAEAGVNYVEFAALEVTIPLGETSKTVPVLTLPTADQEDKTLQVILAGSGNYASGTPSSATLNITNAPAPPITVTALPDERVYDGTVDSQVEPEVVIDGQLYANHALVYDQSFADKHAGAGKELRPSAYVINTETMQDVTAQYDYQITLVTNFTGVITKRILTLSDFTADGKLHDGTADAGGTGFADDRVEGDDLEIDYTAAFADADPGWDKPVYYTGITIIGGADKDNYELTADTGQATAYIRPLAHPVTVTARSYVRVYDGTTDSTRTPLITALFGGDEADLSQSFADKHAGSGKRMIPQVLIRDAQGEDVSQYYDITLVDDFGGAITRRTLTLSNFTAEWRPYDGSTEATGAFADDRLAGDDLVISYNANFGDAEPGLAKTVFFTGIAIVGGADQGNYSLAASTGQATAGLGYMVYTQDTVVDIPNRAWRIGALLVGGGGGGGSGPSWNWDGGGGGGAGGVQFAVLRENTHFQAGDQLQVTVGGGGSGRTSGQASDPGGNSELGIEGGATLLTARGGGRGGNRNGSAGAGGSGGGGAGLEGSGNRDPGLAVGNCLGHDGQAGSGQNGGSGGGAGGAPTESVAGAGISLAGIGSGAGELFAGIPHLQGHFAAGGGGSGPTLKSGGLGGGGGGGRPNGHDATNWGSGGGGSYRQSSGQRTYGGDGYRGIVALYFEVAPRGSLLILR